MASQPEMFIYSKPVAICTLADEALRQQLVDHPALQGIIVGPLHTENLGIEQMVEFCITQPALRFLIVCGEDARQSVGHLPGQSLIALAQNGIDKNGRIIGAQGKRPEIKNLSAEAIEYFRDTVEVLDWIGRNNVDQIVEKVLKCEADPPGPVDAFQLDKQVERIRPSVPCVMISDPLGYFVIAVNPADNWIVLDHYDVSGRHTCQLEADNAKALYCGAIEKKLLSRLDHAAYLGRELYRAEVALKTGQPYIQDDFEKIFS